MGQEGGCREFRGLDEMRANDTLDVMAREEIKGKRDKVLRWPCLIFHHTPKLGMLWSSLICQIVSAEKVDVTLTFLEVKKAKQWRGREWIKDC